MTVGINVNVYFLTSLWYHKKGFTKVFRVFIKPSEVRKCENKNMHSILTAAQDRDVNPLMLGGNKGSTSTCLSVYGLLLPSSIKWLNDFGTSQNFSYTHYYFFRSSLK